MKRIISVLLVLLLLPCMVLPSYAVEAKNYVDLMEQGYIYVDGNVDDDFSFTSNSGAQVEFPVDAIGGMGRVELVVQCGSAVTIQSYNNQQFTKTALSLSNMYLYTADLWPAEKEEIFQFSAPDGYVITIVSAKAYYPDSLSTPLSFNSVFRAGSFRDELNGIEWLEYTLDIEDYMSSSVYTTYVSHWMGFDADDIAGLDSIDLTLFTRGISATSITAFSASNIYVPVEYTLYDSADPAVERNRFALHLDISNVPPGDNVSLYFYGVTTSSSSSFWYEIPQVIGYISRPVVSGEVGLLQKIWIAIEDFFIGDGDKTDQFGDEMFPIESEAEEFGDVLETSPTIDIDDIEDQFDDIVEFEPDSGLMDVFGSILTNDTFSVVFLMGISFALLGYILYGKR